MHACIHDRPYHVRNACMDIEDRHEHTFGKYAAYRRPPPPGFCGLYQHKGARRPRAYGTEGSQQVSISGVLCLYIAIQVLNGARFALFCVFGMNWHSGWRTAAFGRRRHIDMSVLRQHGPSIAIELVAENEADIQQHELPFNVFLP